MASEVEERLELVNRSFTDRAIVSGFPDLWGELLPGFRQIRDTEILDLETRSYDLIVHAMALHWADDPVGQMAQALHALRPDGLFLACMFGGETLNELRSVLATAEAAEMGGLSPRVAPMGEIRDVGALMQRAGFALPVADRLPLTVSYQSAFHLMHDLRAMGETNALQDRHRAPSPRRLFLRAAEEYSNAFSDDTGRVTATFEILFLTGWAPAASQPKPLRPGSATARLADALGTEEKPLNDPPDPSND